MVPMFGAAKRKRFEFENSPQRKKIQTSRTHEKNSKMASSNNDQNQMLAQQSDTLVGFKLKVLSNGHVGCVISPVSEVGVNIPSDIPIADHTDSDGDSMDAFIEDDDESAGEEEYCHGNEEDDDSDENEEDDNASLQSQEEHVVNDNDGMDLGNIVLGTT